MTNPESRISDPYADRHIEDPRLRAEAVALLRELSQTLLLHVEERKSIKDLLDKLEDDLRAKTSTVP